MLATGVAEPIIRAVFGAARARTSARVHASSTFASQSRPDLFPYLRVALFHFFTHFFAESAPLSTRTARARPLLKRRGAVA